VKKPFPLIKVKLESLVCGLILLIERIDKLKELPNETSTKIDYGF